jgi:hypothetical protein
MVGLRFVYFNVNVAAVDFNFMANRGFGSWHGQGCARSHVEFGPVSRATDAAIFDFAIAKRAAIVRADVVDAEQIVTASHQDNQPFVDFNQRHFVIVNIRETGDLLKIGHAPHSFCSKSTTKSGKWAKEIRRLFLPTLSGHDQ